MPNHTTSASEQWLRPREAEEIFGYNEKHLRRLAQRGDIEFKREGAREVRLLKSSIQSYKQRMDKVGKGKFSPGRESNLDEETPDALIGDKGQDASADDESSYFEVLPAARAAAITSHFVLTDCLDLLISPPMPCVSVGHKIYREDIDDILRSHKIGQFFSTVEAADFITRHLGIKLVHSGRPPMISHGDNLILVQIKTNAGSLTPAFVFVLVQFLV